MFWRIIRRLLSANLPRMFVILLALGSGAAATAALLNLQVDAKRRLTTEFRAFGPNIIIAPRLDPRSGETPQTLPESAIERVPKLNEGNKVTAIGWLYLVADALPHPTDPASPSPRTPVPVVVAGYTDSGERQIIDSAPEGTGNPVTSGLSYCDVGEKASSTLNVRIHDHLVLRNGAVGESCSVGYVVSSGGEDSQITVHIELAQRLAQLPGRIGVIQVMVPGPPASIEQYILDLRARFPDADVRPIRQFTEGEAKIYNRISGILAATVAVVLVLTSLCVMAAMTNVAMERRNDVGLMKAIGGATRRVLRLFVVEAALLGMVGGVLGAAVGIVLSIWLGKAVFGVAAQPRLIVYPVAVALTMIVAIAGAYPLRRLANIRPASVFRGEA